MSAISKKNIQEVIPIPRNLSNNQKIELGRRIILEIQKRTKRGIDKNGSSFGNYAKGSEKSGPIDLHSTGDMLVELDVLETTNSSITIGYELDHPNAGQVNGNVTGEYGNSKPVTKARDFIGLPVKSLKLIIEEVRSELPAEGIESASNSLIDSILGRLL